MLDLNPAGRRSFHSESLMKPGRCLLVLLAIVGVSSPVVRAQTGSVDPTKEQLESLPEFVPSRIELIEQPAVDLRPWLPPVGEQRMNDCTAWAVAYAAKTYAEARDQGWKPDRPSRIFSPRFIYNQINDGEDKGSVFVDAIRVMAAKRCRDGAIVAVSSRGLQDEAEPEAVERGAGLSRP